MLCWCLLGSIHHLQADTGQGLWLDGDEVQSRRETDPHFNQRTDSTAHWRLPGDTTPNLHGKTRNSQQRGGGGNECNSIGWLYTVMYLNVWRCNKWVKDLITFLINLLNNFHIWKTWRLHLQCVVLHYMLIYSGNSLILLHFKCGKSSRPSFTTYYFIVQVFTNILHCFVVNSVYL